MQAGGTSYNKVNKVEVPAGKSMEGVLIGGRTN
jgi:hypothetical protein